MKEEVKDIALKQTLPTERVQPAGRVLIADDNPATLRLIRAVVESEGHEVVAARDGREAYRILQHDGDFNAVIFDVMMPHIEGLELIRYMKTERRLMGIPSVVVTAEQSPKVLCEGFAVGALAVVPVPFATGQVRSILRTILSRRQIVDRTAAR